MKLVIPKKSSIIQTSHEDIKQYYYSNFWPIRYMYRKRLQLALDALGRRRYRSLLELGTGGGFLLYSLSKMCDRIVASDIHPNLDKVEHNLTADGLHNIEYKGFDICDVPYKEAEFDSVVAISVLEHIRNLSKAVSEIKRILSDRGVAVIGIPADTPLMTLGFHLIGAGEDVKHHHCNDHKGIIKAFRKEFRSVKVKVFPLPPPFNVYYILKCRK